MTARCGYCAKVHGDVPPEIAHREEDGITVERRHAIIRNLMPWLFS